ncbi:hypothetical protein BD310DRAFT_890685 [Dichomitus squalens]|uniref:DUF6534 domain-containing protein n=1 Tax=Dichomitus squalens TaxID=114155 RepID=A0A4Q9PEU6_9APHY|nr:hypothetical protein BD310DRAFT_890685 [Dichomitus squalens]
MSSNATSTVPTSPPSVPSLDSTYGAVLIGTFLGLILYGLTVHQTFTYFRVYTRDSFLLKFMIFCLAPICQRVVCSSVDGAQTTTVVIAQSFYSRRVYLLGSGYRYAAIVAAMCTLGTIGFGTALSVESFQKTRFSDVEDLTWRVCTVFGLATTADTLLTTALIVFLIRCNTSFQRTMSMLSVLIVYTVNTGLLTSALNLITLVTAALHMNNMIYIAATILAMRSYVLAVLTVVNSRRPLTSSTRGESDFGTFGLGASHQNVMCVPVSLEQFRSPRPEGEVIGISSWKAPADAEVKHGSQIQGVISREDV